MQPYATPADMRARYAERDLAQLTDPDGTTVQDDVLTRAIADAGAEIDGYLASRYTLPLANVPAVLLQHACTIALYNLMRMQPQAVIEDVRNRYKDSITFLRMVARGEAALGIDAATEAAAAQNLGPEVIAPGRVFTRETMGGY